MKLLEWKEAQVEKIFFMTAASIAILLANIRQYKDALSTQNSSFTGTAKNLVIGLAKPCRVAFLLSQLHLTHRLFLTKGILGVQFFAE